MEVNMFLLPFEGPPPPKPLVRILPERNRPAPAEAEDLGDHSLGWGAHGILPCAYALFPVGVLLGLLALFGLLR
jgi:hypothetical protein